MAVQPKKTLGFSCLSVRHASTLNCQTVKQLQIMGTWNVLYVRSNVDSTKAAVRKSFPDAKLALGHEFIGVPLPADDYGSPVCDLGKLSAEFGTDVIWLCFQSVVDAFQFRHWHNGTLVRSLVFGCYGDEERMWTEAEGQPEPWEQEAFFSPKALKIALECAPSDEAKIELERIWREAELLPERLEPSIDARESAWKAAEFYHFPGWN
jgi:hypothetical protein